MNAAELRGLLARLYADQMTDAPGDDYIRYHASEQAISARVNSFLEYQEHLPSGHILDWGCQHAPDACMVRATSAGKSISLTGCDFLPADRYPTFWNYCDLDFVTINHHISLPFEDGTFDGIIGGGVLEHTAMDYESLKELYRVLKPNGTLIITHLPNRYSYVEFVARNIRKKNFHRRLYSVSEISTLLKRTGFYPEKVQRHRLLPTNSLRSITRTLSNFERILDRAWPLNYLCGDILIVAKKVDGM